MTSLFRPLLSSLLCGVIAFGQTPALLHVACCHTAPPASLYSAEEQLETCSNACCQQANQHSDANPEAPQHAPAHDPDTCTICQSLLGQAGLVWVAELPLFVECLSERATLGVDRNPREMTLFIAQPRGPPIVASLQAFC